VENIAAGPMAFGRCRHHVEGSHNITDPIGAPSGIESPFNSRSRRAGARGRAAATLTAQEGGRRPLPAAGGSADEVLLHDREGSQARQVLAIKKQHPVVQVSVYDTVDTASTQIELPSDAA